LPRQGARPSDRDARTPAAVWPAGTEP
jgi:hypothetical protein